MTGLLANESAFLESVSGMNETYLERAHSFLVNASNTSLFERFDKNQQKRNVRLGFNAFALISDVYHRENFHSDVIKALLDPTEEHDQKSLFLLKFIEFLRRQHHIDIAAGNYQTARIAREEGRIDVLMYDPTSKRAVIIENKINNASDMDRQVIRYLEKVESWNYTCDAIIYLTLDSIKTPEMEGWTENERSKITKLLTSIAAFHDADDDLYHGWLRPCIEACKDKNASHVIGQYSQLILKLGNNAMNKPLLEEFYKIMRDPEKKRAALSLQGLLSQLSKYRATRISDGVLKRPYPFGKSWILNNTLVVEGIESTMGWSRNASYLKIHVECDSPEETVVSFWNNQDDQSTTPLRILDDLGIRESFPARKGKWPSRVFSFPEGETELEEFLEHFLKILADYKGLQIGI